MEYVLHDLGFEGLSPVCVCAHRPVAAHRYPHTLALGGRKFIADPLSGHFSLKLGEGLQMLSVSRLIDVSVLKCWVTETKETFLAVKKLHQFHKISHRA